MNLTVIEKNIVQNLPAHLSGYVQAKFSTQIYLYKPMELEAKISALVMKTLLESGVRMDEKTNQIVTFLRETLLKDLQMPKFARLTFEQIEAAFSNGVRQVYGPFMGVNIQTMHFWIKSYLESSEYKLAMSEFKKQQDINEAGYDRSTPPNPEGMKKVVEILKPFADNTKPKYGKGSGPLIDKSPREKFIQECFREHYNIWLKKPFIPPKAEQRAGLEVRAGDYGRLILYNDKAVDEVEFTEIKLKQFDKEN